MTELNRTLLDEIKAHKALAAKPRVQILNILTLHGTMDLETLAERIGLKTITIRHHIKALENANLVETTEVGRATVGRPKQTYRIAERYINLTSPKRQYELLAQHFLEDKIEKDGVEGAASLFRSIGEKMANRMMANLSSLHNIKEWSLDDFIRYVVPELDRLGTRPTVTQSNKELTIKTANCIFFELAKAYPKVVCEGHKALLETFSQAIGEYAVNRTACLTEGDDYCIWVLNKLPKSKK